MHGITYYKFNRTAVEVHGTTLKLKHSAASVKFNVIWRAFWNQL